jgi:hypothetical protein
MVSLKVERVVCIFPRFWAQQGNLSPIKDMESKWEASVVVQKWCCFHFHLDDLD